MFFRIEFFAGSLSKQFSFESQWRMNGMLILIQASIFEQEMFLGPNHYINSLFNAVKSKDIDAYL